jgi:sugar/nucleoside kinase (ribokinase family)
MTTPPRFFGLDTVMIDVVLKIAALPLSGSDAVATDRLVTAGGGFNAMSAAARQGMDVTYLGQLGCGPFADIAAHALQGERIDVPIAARTDMDLGFCVVLVESNGERTFVTSPGAEGTLSRAELFESVPRAGDFVFFSGYNFVYEAIRDETVAWLRQLHSDVVVAFDPGPRVLDIEEAILHEVMRATHWLLCNESEATSMTGVDNVREAINRLSTFNAHGGVVVRTGGDGCLASVGGDEIIEVPALRANVVDTNGAGDVHNGVLLAELARGTTVREALTRANIGAAVAIGSFGPATCPSRDVITEKLAAIH